MENKEKKKPVHALNHCRKGDVLSVRIDRESTALLEQAADRAGKKLREHMRDVLLRSLGPDEQAENFLQKLNSLDENLRGLSRNLANFIEVLLVAVGDVDEDEAKAWVNKYMRS